MSNIKEDVGTNPGVCPYYGKNKWPSAQFKETVLAVNRRMFRSAMLVMRGCDALMEEDRVQHGLAPLEEGRPTFVEIAERGTTLAGRWIWYDSAFSRDDTLLAEKKQADEMAAAASSMDNGPPATTTTTAPHTTPSLLVGHKDDAMASMRTHATAIRSSGAAAASSSSSSSSFSSLSVGHENDEMASMRTHATAIRTSGASSSSSSSSSSLSVGHENDEMASMRTHATAIRTSGASSSTPPSPLRVGHEDDEMASMRTHATAIRSSGANTAAAAACKPAPDDGGDAEAEDGRSSRQEFGDYWLPWHIDSQFITLLTSDEYRSEATGGRVSPEVERQHRTNGLVVMNKRGDVVSVAPQIDDKTMLVQMGGFAQIFSGGLLRSCRHAVSRHTARCVCV